MKIFDLFSKQQKRARGEFPDVFQYSNLPNQFRVQVAHILRDALGDTHPVTDDLFKSIHDILCREYGKFYLNENASHGYYKDSIYNFLVQAENIEQALDVILITFRAINHGVREDGYRYRAQPRIEPEEAIDELNERFREHGIGYQFENDQIIKVDSQVTHANIIKPTLQILTNNMYKGANEEFLKAHEHYRHGRHKECLNECLKSLESTLKAICKKKNWSYGDGDTAKKLLEICFGNDLIPSYLQSQFSSLRSSLESGVPTVRNKLSGHGQGVEKITVPDYFAEYLLNLTATSILLLAKAEQSHNK